MMKLYVTQARAGARDLYHQFCREMAVSTSQVLALASFCLQARGIKFYSVPTRSIRLGDSLHFHLEPTNFWDNNCVSIWICSLLRKKLGHLAKESASVLAPLLRAGLSAAG